MGTRLLRILLGALLAAAAVGCVKDEFGGADVTVLAATSLTDAMTAIAADFEDATGRKALLRFGASDDLAAQIREGALADVFASTDDAAMDALVASGDIAGWPRRFARSKLTLAVPTGNPKGVAGLGDLARAELTVGLCAASTRCGSLAREAATKAGVTPAVDTDVPDVGSLLAKLESGEVDVGVVYATDITAGPGLVSAIPIPDPQNVTANHPIAALKRAKEKKGAEDFVGFVLGQGQQFLIERGFEPAQARG